MSALTQKTIGVYNDLTPELLEVWLNQNGNSVLIGYPYGSETIAFTYSPQFLGNIILWLFHSAFNPFLANNLLILCTSALTTYFSLKLFRHLFFSRKVSWFLALSFAFSPYFLYRVVSLSQLLYFTFVFPLLLYMLLSKKKPLFIGLFITFTFYLSNYYGYFCFITTLFFYAAQWVYHVARERTQWKAATKRSVLNGITVVTVILVTILLPHTRVVSLSSHLFGNYDQQSIQAAGLEKTIPLRDIQGFFSYTFRPWYFVLPPTDSVLMGTFSEKVYDRLAATEYFLTLNYDVQEAGGAFMGYTYPLLALLALYFLWKQKDEQVVRIVVPVMITALLLLSISGPPFFTISGYTFYTPNALLYYVMPAFRVLVRLSVVLFLLLLILAGYGLQNIEKRMAPRPFSIFLGVLYLLGVGQFAITLPVINGHAPPAYIPAIQAHTSEQHTTPPVVAIYPNTIYEARFWLPYQGIALANPEYFRAPSFEANTFTEVLPTVEGIKKAREHGVEWLLVFPKRIDEEERAEISTFFNETLDTKQTIGNVDLYRITP